VGPVVLLGGGAPSQFAFFSNVYIERIHLFDYDSTAFSLVSNILVG
jgi:hypothetical protein